MSAATVSCERDRNYLRTDDLPYGKSRLKMSAATVSCERDSNYLRTDDLPYGKSVACERSKSTSHHNLDFS
ncbi:hypothetical protein QE152_g3512 [Popillia japonica]|uniref:Uncharacterized protein n=1 Tax=Popillia japonica TaxID=7064 RepID=A0AAW1N0G0_POPJA